MKRIGVMFATALIGVLALSGVAGAGYPSTPFVTGSDSTVTPGEPVTVTGHNLDPGSSATADLNSVTVALGAKTVASDGTVSYTVTIPSNFSGAHNITIHGLSNGLPVDLVFNFTVAAQTSPGGSTGGGAIPRTGSDSTLPMTGAGIALLAAGAGAVYVSRRRRRVAV
jgi:LPXTG-motif cell wall-anchored protein